MVDPACYRHARMQPEIDLGPLTLQTFGICFGLAFLAAGALLARRLQELGKPVDWAYEIDLRRPGRRPRRLAARLPDPELGRRLRRPARQRLLRLRAGLVRRPRRRARSACCCGRAGAASSALQPARPDGAGAGAGLRDRARGLPALRRRRLRRRVGPARGRWPIPTAPSRPPTRCTRRPIYETLAMGLVALAALAAARPLPARGPVRALPRARRPRAAAGRADPAQRLGGRRPDPRPARERGDDRGRRGLAAADRRICGGFPPRRPSPYCAGAAARRCTPRRRAPAPRRRPRRRRGGTRRRCRPRRPAAASTPARTTARPGPADPAAQRHRRRHDRGQHEQVAEALDGDREGERQQREQGEARPASAEMPSGPRGAAGRRPRPTAAGGAPRAPRRPPAAGRPPRPGRRRVAASGSPNRSSSSRGGESALEREQRSQAEQPGHRHRHRGVGPDRARRGAASAISAAATSTPAAGAEQERRARPAPPARVPGSRPCASDSAA